jgi:DNA-binding MarR family transcriptional regulator
MHPQIIFTKTSKGLQEVINRTIRLPQDLGLLFLAVDGRCTVSGLSQKAGMDESSLVQALDKLVADGYIRLFYEPPEAGQSVPVSGDVDLDFT